MIGVGLDAVDIDRFRSTLERSPRMADRLFTTSELELAARRADTAAVLAARFAVREATMKALGVGLGAFDFKDVSVVSSCCTASQRCRSGRTSRHVAIVGGS